MSDTKAKKIHLFHIDTREYLVGIDVVEAPMCMCVEIIGYEKDDLIFACSDHTIRKINLKRETEKAINGHGIVQYMWKTVIDGAPFDFQNALVVLDVQHQPFVSDVKEGKLVFVCSRHLNQLTVLRSSDGQIIQTFHQEIEPVRLKGPWGIAVTPTRDLLLTASQLGHHRILKLGNGGFATQLVGCFGSTMQMQIPTAILVDQVNENIIVCSGNHKIIIYNSAGEFIKEYGCLGKDSQGLNTPCGLCLDERKGFLFVSDLENQRVMVFK